MAREKLSAARCESGHWEGELSSSALSTATAVCALSLVARASQKREDQALMQQRINAGLDWLARHVNGDGGWGDTVLSLSNVSTTALCWAAFGAVLGADQKYSRIVSGCEDWLADHAGSVTPEKFVPAIIRRYGKDRTFSVPILTMCALAGRLGSGSEMWRWVLPLPFELAVCPHSWFAALRLPVVSYALPALIAIGQVRHQHRPSRNPVLRGIRNLARKPSLRVLARIQPSSGGFLEATPLTSFVVMSLAGSGAVENEVTVKGVEFLLKSPRPDGSWPIDTNLATWLTTLSVNALGPCSGLSRETAGKLLTWLLRQQYQEEHPYTHAAPGGWAWTDLPGGVPDADDTAGALLALKRLGNTDAPVLEAGVKGVQWLLGLQNRDGGIPTFCRGWGNLPFDRSSPDLTAHALRAWLEWRECLSPTVGKQIARGVERAIAYLKKTQRSDGSWVPLWFGNQHEPGDENPTYGTSRVLLALQEIFRAGTVDVTEPLRRGTDWLLAAQQPDGGWGGFPGGPVSVEETAWALEALARSSREMGLAEDKTFVDPWERAVRKGAEWLMERIEAGSWTEPAPVGFYFAKLWYYERLYPQIFTVAALERLKKLFPVN
jgi:squalene-hopene/tetraprenyl-beta-curcumene cyclase